MPRDITKPFRANHMAAGENQMVPLEPLGACPVLEPVTPCKEESNHHFVPPRRALGPSHAYLLLPPCARKGPFLSIHCNLLASPVHGGSGKWRISQKEDWII